MDLVAFEELRLCQAASLQEASFAEPGARLYNAEAFQRALWIHRGAVMAVLEGMPELEQRFEQLTAALRPFARVSAILTPRQNPVLLSIPRDGGRDFVQLRPADFHLAARLVGERRP